MSSTNAGEMTGRFIPAPDAGTTRSLSRVNVYTTNFSSYRILFRLFSKSRSWLWPSNSRWYVSPNDRRRYVAAIQCQTGEKICVGGYAPTRSGYYWGIGPKGDKGCSSCCFICRPGNFYTGFRN